MPNATRLGSIRLSVYNSVFNLNRGNNQFLYASEVLGSSNFSSNTNTSTYTNTNTSSNITSIPNYNKN